MFARHEHHVAGRHPHRYGPHAVRPARTRRRARAPGVADTAASGPDRALARPLQVWRL